MRPGSARARHRADVVAVLCVQAGEVGGDAADATAVAGLGGRDQGLFQEPGRCSELAGVLADETEVVQAALVCALSPALLTMARCRSGAARASLYRPCCMNTKARWLRVLIRPAGSSSRSKSAAA
jgi:hypothetical protein